jgi:hypothetical protein
LVQPEGNSGTTAFIWTLTLNRDGSTAAYPFNWAVTGSGASPADAADFGGALPSGSGTFAAGETSKSITVLASGDTAVEPTDSFTLTVTAAGLNTITSTGTISNDDVAAPSPIAFGTPIITIGPSIQNVVNVLSPRVHMSAASLGHLYPTPGTNQATGAASALTTGTGSTDNYYEHPLRIDMVMKQLGDPAARGKVLVQYDPGPNDVFSAANVANLVAAMDRWIARVTGAGHMIMLSPVLEANSFVTDSVRQAARQAFNDTMATRHAPGSGIFYCGSRLAATNGRMVVGDLSYDGLHPNWKGGQIIGAADWGDLAPFAGAGSLWTDAASYVAPFGQASNSKGAFGGNTGVAGTGASGEVAAGWEVYASSNGQAGGTTTGVTATCSKGAPVQRTINGQTITLNQQIIRLTGTATAAGQAVLIGQIVKGLNAAQYFNAGEFGQAAFLYDVYGATPGTAPVGIGGMGIQYGLLGSAFNKIINASANTPGAAMSYGSRTVPAQSLKLNGAQNLEIAASWASGAVVDTTIVVYQAVAMQVEQMAYAAPFNLSTAFPNGANPLTRRPALTGSVAVGGTGILNPPAMSGGGVGLYGNSHIRRADNSTIATYAPTANPFTRVWQAGDAGVVRMTAETANSFGSLVVDDGPTVTVA